MKNGIFIDLEMKNIPIDEILKGKEKIFLYTTKRPLEEVFK